MLGNKLEEVLAKFNRDNIMLSLQTKENKDGGFIAVAQGNIFNPEIILEGGGPVTVKQATIEGLGKTFEDAQKSALEKLAVALGL